MVKPQDSASTWMATTTGDARRLRIQTEAQQVGVEQYEASVHALRVRWSARR